LKLIQIIVFFSFVSAFSQGISVDNSYTANQLVDMLLNDACVEVSNISMSSNISVGNFDSNNSDFPIDGGVILRSGEVVESAGVYTGQNLTTQANNNTDQDLQNIANSSGQSIPVTDVAFLQFDFVPISNKVSFDFLMASNEYGEYQCISNDAIGFVLKNLDTGESTNIGVIPQTVVPVSVKNIRDNIYNASCVADNEEYFDTYNVSNPENSSVNMRGFTQIMTAQADLQPGDTYQIRFLVGDSNDAQFDTSVFLAAGSFETKLDLGEDETLCGNETLTLNTQVDANVYQHAWYKDGELIVGETGTTYTVTTGGFYDVVVTNNDGDCSVSDQIVLNQFEVGEPENLELCYSSGGYEIPLLQIMYNEIIIGGPVSIYDVAFFYSEEEAQNYENPITVEFLEDNDGIIVLPPNENSIQTIWAVAQSNDGSECYVMVSFDIIENPLPDPHEGIENLVVCDTYVLPDLEEGYTYSNPDVDLQPGMVLTEDITVQINSPLNEFGCGNYTAYSVKFIQQYIEELQASQTACDAFIVPAILSDYVTYYTEIDGPNGNGEIIEPGTSFTEDVIIYAYAEIDGVICVNEPIEKTVIPRPQLPEFTNIVTCEDYYTLPEIVIDTPYDYAGYFTAPNGEGEELPAGTQIDSFQQIYAYAVLSSDNGTCYDQDTFNIKVIPEFDDVEQCKEFMLEGYPEMVKYYTEPLGEGVEIETDSLLTESQTIYVYAATNLPNCTDYLSFDLNIFDAPPVDSLANVSLLCDSDSFILPELNNGNYFTEPLGGGDQLFAGDVITEPQTVYIYNGEDLDCYSEISFEIENDYLPQLENFTDLYECDYYELESPAQGNFYTETLGGGQMLNSGDIITETQLIYIYIDGGPNSPCFQEKAFTVNIVDADIDGDFEDVSVCDEYILPELEEGNYFTESGGEGTMLPAGTSITETQDIYVYLEKGVRVFCIGEDVFTVTVSSTPELPNYQDIEACGSYSLPDLPSLDASLGYYWSPYGQDEISSDDYLFSEPGNYTIYVYAASEENQSCDDQEQFQITIYPLLDFEVEGGTLCLDPETGEVQEPLLLESGIDPSEFQIDWFLNGNLVYTGENFLVDTPGEYTIETTKLTPENGANCNYNPTSVEVNASSVPIVEANVSEDFSDIASITVIVIEGYGEYMFQLDNAPFQWDNVFNNVSSGEHLITVTDVGGNCGEVELIVDVLNYPKFFTPNNDGVNDTWNITDLSNNRDAMIYIHDRFGKLLVSFPPSRGEWDGVYNGANMPSNDYWFKVIYTRDGKQKEFVSHFTLKR